MTFDQAEQALKRLHAGETVAVTTGSLAFDVTYKLSNGAPFYFMQVPGRPKVKNNRWLWRAEALDWLCHLDALPG